MNVSFTWFQSILNDSKRRWWGVLQVSELLIGSKVMWRTRTRHQWMELAPLTTTCIWATRRIPGSILVLTWSITAYSTLHKVVRLRCMSDANGRRSVPTYITIDNRFPTMDNNAQLKLYYTTKSLSLTQRLIRDSLRLTNLRLRAWCYKWVWSFWHRLQRLAVMFIGLWNCQYVYTSIWKKSQTLRHVTQQVWERPTNGSPQYSQGLIWGLSRLMYTLGCPNGPPPPSQTATLSFRKRTGCWWIRSIAACGAGYT